MHGIEGQQMGGGGRIASGIVHVHQLDAGAAPQGPKHEAANAAEAVDSDPHAEPSKARTLDQDGLMNQSFLMDACL
jgi:hypothetical protein